MEISIRYQEHWKYSFRIFVMKGPGLKIMVMSTYGELEY